MEVVLTQLRDQIVRAATTTIRRQSVTRITTQLQSVTRITTLLQSVTRTTIVHHASSKVVRAATTHHVLLHVLKCAAVEALLPTVHLHHHHPEEAVVVHLPAEVDQVAEEDNKLYGLSAPDCKQYSFRNLFLAAMMTARIHFTKTNH